MRHEGRMGTIKGATARQQSGNRMLGTLSAVRDSCWLGFVPLVTGSHTHIQAQVNVLG